MSRVARASASGLCRDLGDCDRVLATGCQGFRRGSLLRRDPAQPALRGRELVEPPCSLCEQGVSKPSCACPGSCGRVRFSGAGGFDSAVRMNLTCWLNRLRGENAHVLAQPVSKGGGLTARSSPGFCLMYTYAWFLARRYLAQFPQGRKAARVSELFRVREGPFSFAAARIRDAGLATSPRDPPLGFGSGCSLAFTARLNQLCGRRGRLWGNLLPGRRGRRESVGGLQYS